MSADTGIKRAKRIFDEAIEMPATHREAFIQEACGSKPDLRRQVESMLREFESGTDTGGFSPPIRQNLSFGEQKPAEFLGNARFSVQRQLGSGAFGTVYQVWDREQHVTVAIKVLHNRRPDVLFRFKREFRLLIDVRHSNLVRLYELFSQHEQWFYSMELIEGDTFLEYVRPGGERCDLDRLRSALPQLVAGIQTLHGTMRLHRDLKPANALVTRSGRVVVLDFGLVRELDRLKADQSQTMIGGTPAYMAPEQMLQGTISEASDWYAVGVMLFESLTGRLPHDGSALARWMRNSPEILLEPRQLTPDIPDDLNALCRDLLHPLAAERPNGASIFNRIAGASLLPAKEDAYDHVGEADVFVGRSDQLHELDLAFADSQEGRFNLVLMDGRSGIGKTALVRRFLARLAERNPNLIVLKGRCYEFESVPYKGLDSLVDELSRYLQQLPESRAEALLARDAFLLPKLFPVLGRVKAIAHAPARSAIVPDAQELRQRTFTALRELLCRLSDRQPVVVWIDDLQWGDRDSSTFLADLCSPPEQPSLLLLLTYRSEELASNATLQYIHQVLASHKVLGQWRQMELHELSPEETRQIIRQLLPREKGVSDNAQAAIMKEAAGHPLFIQQLVRFASSRKPNLVAESGSGKELKLTAVLQRRVAEVPPFAREVLEFICTAAQRLTISVLFTAAESGDIEERADTLGLLIREKFIRTSGISDERQVEPYHDQIRTAVMQSLTPELRSRRHRQLAKVLAAQPETEPQVLVTHYQEAGDMRAAYEAALKAADTAESQLAFDRAAVFYQSALATGETEPSRTSELFRKLADMLGLAGRGRDAAHAYLKAAESSDADSQFDLQRLAADQLMRSGYIDEGLSLFEELARRVDIQVPHSPAEAVRKMALARLRSRAALFSGPPDCNKQRPSAYEMARLELLRSGAVILNIADPVLAAYYQTQYVVEALRVREPVHLAIALSLEATIRLAGGKGNVRNAFRLMDRAEQIAVSTADENALGLLYLFRSYVDYLLCHIPEGVTDTERAIHFLRERCTGAAWELTGGYVLLFWFLCWSGRLREVRERLPQLLKEGAARGDVNVEVSLRLLSYVHYSYLSLDQAQEYITDCETALERWSKRGYHLQHYGAMFAIVESYLYLGDYTRARGRLLADWDITAKSFILRWQTLLIMALFLRGRVALAWCLQHPREPRFRAEVKRYAERLKKVGSKWCHPMGRVLDAGLAAGDGQTGKAAQMLEMASAEFEEQSLYAYAAAARHFSGVLSGGEHGRDLKSSAASFLHSQDVVNAAAFLRMLLPGPWTAPDTDQGG